ncbi:MAG: hypothetical protein Q9222_003369 [Ikaeria aurantiellina]
MAVLRKLMTRLSGWIISNPEAEEAYNAYGYEVQLGLKTRINKSLQKSATIDHDEHILCQKREVSASRLSNAVALDSISEASPLNPSHCKDKKRKVESTIEENASGQKVAAVSSLSPAGSPLNPVKKRQGALGDSTKTNKLPSSPSTATPLTFRHGNGTLNKEIDRILDDSIDLADLSAAKFDSTATLIGSQPSSSMLMSVTPHSHRFETSPLSYKIRDVPKQHLALLPYRSPSFWDVSFLASLVADNDANSKETPQTTDEVLAPSSKQQTCKCQERHQDEIDDLKEEHTIDMELLEEKLNNKHEEETAKLQQELDQAKSRIQYVQGLAKKQFDGSKERFEKRLQDVEAELENKDNVIQQMSAFSSELQSKVETLEAANEEAAQNYAVLAQYQQDLAAFVAAKEAHIEDLQKKLHSYELNAQVASQESSNMASYQEPVFGFPMSNGVPTPPSYQQLQDQLETMTLAYRNVYKEVVKADDIVKALESQLHNMNGELEQEPARLAETTRLLEYKDGQYLQMQEHAGYYNRALLDCQKKAQQDKQHAQNDRKVLEAECDVVQSKNSALESRLQAILKEWEKIVEMFSQRVFAKDVKEAANSLYAVVKNDNTFLCQHVEAQQVKIAELLQQERRLNAKIVDQQDTLEKADTARQDLERKVRALEFDNETAGIEKAIEITEMERHLNSQKSAISALTKKANSLDDILNSIVRPGEAEKKLLEHREEEISVLQQKIEEMGARTNELEHMLKGYSELESWKKAYDDQMDRQDFTIRSLEEKVEVLKGQLNRASLLCQDHGINIRAVW